MPLVQIKEVLSLRGRAGVLRPIRLLLCTDQTLVSPFQPCRSLPLKSCSKPSPLFSGRAGPRSAALSGMGGRGRPTAGQSIGDTLFIQAGGGNPPSLASQRPAQPYSKDLIRMFL